MNIGKFQERLQIIMNIHENENVCFSETNVNESE